MPSCFLVLSRRVCHAWVEEACFFACAWVGLQGQGKQCLKAAVFCVVGSTSPSVFCRVCRGLVSHGLACRVSSPVALEDKVYCC